MLLNYVDDWLILGIRKEEKNTNFLVVITFKDIKVINNASFQHWKSIYIPQKKMRLYITFVLLLPLPICLQRENYRVSQYLRKYQNLKSTNTFADFMLSISLTSTVWIKFYYLQLQVIYDIPPVGYLINGLIIETKYLYIFDVKLSYIDLQNLLLHILFPHVLLNIKRQQSVYFVYRTWP